MGERGSLPAAAIPSHLRVVPEAVAAAPTAADAVPKLAPRKPRAVAGIGALSELWDEVVPQLDDCGLLAPSDGPALEMALRHFLMARQAFDEVGEDITVADRDDSIKKNPAEAVFRAESAAFLRYATQLGMTFVARARTPAPKGSDDGSGDANPFGPPVR